MGSGPNPPDNHQPSLGLQAHQVPANTLPNRISIQPNIVVKSGVSIVLVACLCHALKAFCLISSASACRNDARNSSAFNSVAVGGSSGNELGGLT
jgi:hypothetical protein